MTRRWRGVLLALLALLCAAAHAQPPSGATETTAQPPGGANETMAQLPGGGDESPTAESWLRLRNSSLSVQPSSAGNSSSDPDVAAAEQMVLLSLGREGMGRQAYVEPTTLELTGGGGVNPLESDSVVEANNTLILLSGNATSYRALELVLNQNNTLLLSGNASLDLGRSTLRAVESNWILVTGGSALALDRSRLNLTDWFTLLVEDSSLNASRSVLATRNFITAWNRSQVALTDATFRSLAPAPRGREGPPLYEGRLAPLTYVANSAVDVAGTRWDVEAAPLAVNNSTLALRRSTLTLLRGARMSVVDSALSLENSQVRLDRASLVLRGLSPTLNVTRVVVRRGDQAAAQALVGQPLGSVPVELSGADMDIYLQDRDSAASAAAAAGP